MLIGQSHHILRNYTINTLYLFLILQNLQLVRLAFCTSRNHRQFTITALSYVIVLLLILFILTFLTLRSTMSAFRREGVLSYIATAITLSMIPVFTVILALASAKGVFEEDVVFVWVEFAVGVLLPILIMATLFLPNVRALVFLC